MKSDTGLAKAIFYGMDTYKSVAAMEKIFVLSTCSYISPIMETFKYIIDFMQVLSASHPTN
jgi:hypothetical protein